MRRLYALLPLLLLSSTILTAQELDTIRVCTFNIDTFYRLRIKELRSILDEIRPDILLVQDIVNEMGYGFFLDSVASRLNSPLTGYGFYGLTKQPSYSAIFFDPQQFHPVIGGEIEDDYALELLVGQMIHRLSGDTIDIHTNQWPEGETEGEEARWYSARMFSYWLDIPKENFINSRFYLFGGTFNFYDSEERAYQELAQPDTGRVIDPIARPGHWQDKKEFADIHTASTRASGSGSNRVGGLKGRLDMLLLSRPLLQRYVPGSYTTFGNDGQHFGRSVNEQPNLAVTPAMAELLHKASDHLPVYLDLVFPKMPSDVPFIASPLLLDLANE